MTDDKEILKEAATELMLMSKITAEYFKNWENLEAITLGFLNKAYDLGQRRIGQEKDL